MMVVSIPLTQGYSTVVDDEDARLADLKWFSLRYDNGRVYAVRNKTWPTRGLLRMHRLITSAPATLEVDHLNGDTLDNRRSNLRVVTRAQNAQNLATRKNSRSGYRGVHWVHGSWEARVMRDQAIVYREQFSTLEDAVKAVQLARKRLLPFDVQGTLNVSDEAHPAPRPNRHNVAKTHCFRGHELAGANLKIESGGVRRCLTCRRARSATKRKRLSTAS
jgi:hypothetical protein